MIPTPDAKLLVLGELPATLQAWRLVRSAEHVPVPAGGEAFDLLALLGHVHRLQPDPEVGQWRTQLLEELSPQAPELLAAAAPALLGLAGWQQRAAEFVQWLDASIEQTELPFAASPERAVAVSCELLRQLDDAELALWALPKLGVQPPSQAIQGCQEAARYFLEHCERFIDAAELACALLEAVDPRLEETDPALWATTEKLFALAPLALEPLDPLPDLGSPGSELARATATTEREGVPLSRRPRPCWPALRPSLLAAAAPGAPGEPGFELFVWQAANRRWEARLEVPAVSTEQEQHRTLNILLFGPEGRYEQRFDGGSLLLCGLLLPVRGYKAEVPQRVLRMAWESWGKHAPSLEVRPTYGTPEHAALVLPTATGPSAESGG